MRLSLSHLGYLPESPKFLTLLPEGERELAERIPFYIRQNCIRMERDVPPIEGFSARFPAPYDLMRGNLTLRDACAAYFRGELVRVESSWGPVWQADFSDFQQTGSYQIETDRAISPPFAIREGVYDRIILGYMNFLRAQRCGTAVFGVHEACHLDDGVLDVDGTPLDTTGGWHDAGDFRKWMAFTQYHVEALLTLHDRMGPALEAGGISPASLLDEVAWGNRYFHRMITAEGQVYEDVAGGSAPAGSTLSYVQDWWFENHPGCFGDASDNRWTDNVPGSGDERRVRTTYNPLVQWAFVHVQARANRVLRGQEGAKCLELAKRAAEYARRRGHDGRTLFLTSELRGELELLAAGDATADGETVSRLARGLMARQVAESGSLGGLAGYFEEAGGADGFRSIAFAADPALALLRCWELRGLMGQAGLAEEAARAVAIYIERYLLPESATNPFGLTPYGVYFDPPHAEKQQFRDAGNGRGVRTFLHPFNPQGIVHGTSSVLMSHAHLLARAGKLFANARWTRAAERLLHWCLGHNTLNRSLFSGIGYHQPIGYSFRIPQLPEAMVVGFIGRPDDSPYLEESAAIEWNTLEYWSVPFLQAAQAACWLRE